METVQSNRNQFWLILVLILVIVLIGGGYYFYQIFIKTTPVISVASNYQNVSQNAETKLIEYKSPKGEIVKLKTPLANTKVASPLNISGEAKGTWAFEASFPAILIDANGKVLVEVPATLQGEWMTTNFVPFTASLTFEKPATPNGKLILKKDNPSDQRELDDQVEIPVKF